MFSRSSSLAIFLIIIWMAGVAGAAICLPEQHCSCCPDDSAAKADSMQCASTPTVQTKTFGPALELFADARSNFEVKPLEKVLYLSDPQLLELFSRNRLTNLPHAPPMA